MKKKFRVLSGKNLQPKKKAIDINKTISISSLLLLLLFLYPCFFRAKKKFFPLFFFDIYQYFMITIIIHICMYVECMKRNKKHCIIESIVNRKKFELFEMITNFFFHSNKKKRKFVKHNLVRIIAVDGHLNVFSHSLSLAR